MKMYTKEEAIINSLYESISFIDMNLVNSIINKMLLNNSYEELIHFLNILYDLAKIPNNIANKLMSENYKECISVFLENEDILYFLNGYEILKLKTFINVCEVNIKLKKSYDYY